MRRIITRVVVALTLVVSAGCSENQGAPTGASSATPQQTAAMASATPTATASAAATMTAAAAATDAPSAAPTASAAPDTTAAVVASAAPSGSAAAAPAGSGTAAAGAKTFDCGAKGQKLCPMQAWMKGAMGSASSSGDAAKLASALAYAAGKPPPGMSQWAAIGNAGAAKAKAGDIDGAKATCKQCHDLYKEKYKSSMRDRPW